MLLITRHTVKPRSPTESSLATSDVSNSNQQRLTAQTKLCARARTNRPLTRLYPQFVDNIRTITPSRANATLKFTALDRVEQLRRRSSSHPGHE
jgi:hypothetical protein